MIRINLIPHREAFRQQQIIEYIVAFTAAVLLSITIVVVINASITQDLTTLQEERVHLEVKNKSLSKKIGELRNLGSLREEVEGKLQIVDELQAGRFRSLETLDGIANAMPQNIWLISFADNNGTLSLDGFAESSQAIANFMRALERDSLFDNVKLSVDKSAEAEGAEVRSFSLSLRRLTLAQQEAKEKAKSAGVES
ncbi:MAG TPA: fimbrial assembly protein [Mariprofundaceae bacterium]|nr:fimbrial assembly protein [Mariprofundaceae bacterium]